MASDRYKYFRIEAAELLEQLSHGMLLIEQQGASEQLITSLLRQAHTLKGAARVVRQIEIADAAHAIEDELAPYQTSGGKPNVQVLLALLDQCSRALSLLTPAERTPTAGEASPSDRADLEPENLHPLVRADLRDVDAVREGVSESLAELAQLRAESELFFSSRELVELIERQVLAPRLPHVQQYELLLRSTHSMVTEVLQNMRRFERRFNATLDRAERELSQAHETAEQLRLVEAGSIFAGLERAVRDAAVELGKEVRFEGHGGDVKLDGHILDTVSRALVQMVRNAVAHGIEQPRLRASLDKTPVGLVAVVVKRSGHNICFSCRDDGQGIDVKQLFRLAGSVESGQLTGDSDETGPDTTALLNVLLNARVSTAAKVSSVSGRGVGMGIVKDAMATVGAKLEAHNVPGAGLTLDILVPATLTSLVGLCVDAGDELLVFPLSDVARTARLTPASLIDAGKGEQHLRLGEEGEELVPYAPLASLLGRTQPDVAPRAAVVLKAGNERLAVGVARLLGSRTQVLHRLPKEVGQVPTVSGAVVDALGNPQLVLSTAGLIAAKRRTVTFTRPAPHKKPILVVDDSLTTRMLQQSVLESAGYTVELATSAEEGLAMASQTDYGLFLVDVEMPGMNGFAFVEHTRADARWRHVPAILVSSRSAPEDLARGEAVGASAYMVKDRYDQRELLRWIRNILGY